MTEPVHPGIQSELKSAQDGLNSYGMVAKDILGRIVAPGRDVPYNYGSDQNGTNRYILDLVRDLTVSVGYLSEAATHLKKAVDLMPKELPKTKT